MGLPIDTAWSWLWQWE